MSLIGLAGITPDDYFRTRIVPALCRNKAHYGEEVQAAIARFESVAAVPQAQAISRGKSAHEY